MKRLFFVVSVLAIFIINTFSAWDLELNGSNCTITMQLISAPFEGRNNEANPNVRLHEMYNGGMYRWFGPEPPHAPEDFPLIFKLQEANQLRAHSCYYEAVGQISNLVYGFGKYLITFTPNNDPNKKISLYYNILDSKLGTDDYQGKDYHDDIQMTYFYNNGSPYVTVTAQFYSITRTVYQSNPPTEIAVWDLFYNRQTPWETDFQIRATPFPFSPVFYQSPYDVEGNFILGTTAIIGTSIYNNSGSTDKFGYNTEIGFPQNYYTNPPIPSGETNVQGKTVTTPAWRDGYDNFLNLTAESGNKLILKPDMKFWISGIATFGGDKLQFKSGSTLRLESNSEIRTCREGQLIIHDGTILELSNPSNQYCHLGSKIIYNGGTHTINNGSAVTILNGGTLELTAGTKIIFDGAGSKLKLNSGSNLKLGQGASLEFKNGAYIDADNSTFSSLNGGDVWNGIKLDKSGEDVIKYCTFTGANTYIEVLNDASSHENMKTITGNIFNNGLVRLENISQCYISDNNFNSPSGSNDLLQITNNISFSPKTWNLKLVYNWFNGGGTFQCKLQGYSGNVPSFYMYHNRFMGGAVIGVYGNNIEGTIKFSDFTSADYSVGFDLSNSSVNFYGNTIKSTSSNTLWLKSGTLGRLAPLQNDANQLEWYGGTNKITSSNSNCLYFQSSSDAVTEKGSNCFSLGNLSNYHIKGEYSGNCSGTITNYFATRNRWNDGCSPNLNITCNSSSISTIYSPCISICPVGSPSTELASTVVSDIGGGMYDTLIVTSDYSGGDGDGGGNSSETKKTASNEDRTLYSQALKNKRERQYTLAITKSKNIIDNYDTSKYVIPALDEIYQNYQNIDTLGNSVQLFNDLKSYLQQKMNQYQNNSSFVEKAYGYFLKSLVKTGQYTEAIAGYENIMNNHPDATVRLLASWDRAAVVLLMGQGGGDNSLSSTNNKLKTRRLLDRNPAHKIAKDVFKESDAVKHTGLSDETIEELNEEDSKITQRATRFNPLTLKELEEKMDNDNKLLLELSIKRNEKQSILNTPRRFTLHQNYPNPFNPQTTIKYEMPKDAFITVKIYDILGKEVFNINEFKKAGSYEIKFDGSDFASGIYFYSFESGNFKDTKKMVLVK